MLIPFYIGFFVAFIGFGFGYTLCRQLLYDIVENEVGQEKARKIFGKKPLNS